MTAIPGKRQQRREDLRAAWDALLPEIGGGASLPAAIRKLPAPRPTVWALRRLLQTDPELNAAYREACELRADALADELVAVASEEIPAGLHGADASAWVQRQRLRFDALRWTASKLRPRAWGDSVAVAVEVEHRISITAALQAAEQRLLTVDADPCARIGAIPEAAEQLEATLEKIMLSPSGEQAGLPLADYSNKDRPRVI